MSYSRNNDTDHGMLDYIKNQQYELFNGYDWAETLSIKPQLSKHCNWDVLTGNDWSRLLTWQPQFIDRCDFSKMTNIDLKWLLQTQPELKNHPLVKLHVL